MKIEIESYPAQTIFHFGCFHRIAIVTADYFHRFAEVVA